MGRVPRWLSAVVLRAWIASKSGEVDRLPRPWDAPESHSMGVDSDRVLILGGGPAVGWGVLSHEIALPGALSRALSSRTGRGADVYVAAVPRLKVSSARDALSRLELHRYDALVVTLGVNDAAALTPLTSWERDLTSTLQVIARRSSPDSRIFVAGVHPFRSIPIYDSPLGSLADAHARKMNTITAQVCSQLPRATYVPLSAPEPCDPLRIRNAMSYRHWADELADRMAPDLDAWPPIANFTRPLWSDDDADSRQERAAAVKGLGTLLEDRSRRFDDVLALACTSFGVKSATVSVIDSDRLVHKAQVGDVPPLIMLGQSFTATVIRERDGMVISDAATDARFRSLPHVAGEPHVRFYAGFALESPVGVRIGTLNIFDPAPQSSDEYWRRLRLRQFGLMVQSELRRGGEGAGGSGIVIGRRGGVGS
ncbi:MAG: diguanylate cyclase [Rhodoglobus sp.]|nr:diguanylate cyclase [Rhodoglobus sp.]